MEWSNDKSQSEIFLESEGDAWFSRNRDQLESINASTVDVDFITNCLKPFIGSVENILEIGCGSGGKVERLANYFGATGFGIDPSQLAISEAHKLAGRSEERLNFEVGLATDLPFPDGMFDIVFFGFCLYLISPHETYRAISEAERILKNGGFMVILDFDYGSLKVNPYKHAPGLFSYKNSYSEIFMASGYYSLVSKWSFSLASGYFSEDREERISIEVLYKELP